MNKLPLLGLLLAVGAALGQVHIEPRRLEAERARIATERAAAEARHAREEVDCRARFAVNDCVRESVARRRMTLAELRKQELALNAAERQRRSEERRRALADKAAGPSREAPSPEQGRGSPAATPGPVPVPKAVPPSPVQLRREPVAVPSAAGASERERTYQRKLDESSQRKQKVLERNALRSKPAAAPLPVPN